MCECTCRFKNSIRCALMAADAESPNELVFTLDLLLNTSSFLLQVCLRSSVCLRTGNQVCCCCHDLTNGAAIAYHCGRGSGGAGVVPGRP